MARAGLERSRSSRSRHRRRRSGRRILLWIGLSTLAALLIAFFVLTDAAPRAEAGAPATAVQVGAGRDAVYQLRNGQKGIGGASRIRWGAAHLDGLGALATQGLSPDRLRMELFQDGLYITASHKLLIGRWLNVNIVASKGGAGFPETSMRIGSLPLNPYFSRKLFEAGRWLLRWRGTNIAPLDQLVSDFTVDQTGVSARVVMPAGSGLIDQLVGGGGGIDPDLVRARYCALAKAQAASPERDFAMLVRRAFPADQAADATPETNRAGFIALAMLVVDTRVGYLGKVDTEAVAKCAAPATAFLIHGRTDLPKHWSLSAALAARTGTQLAEAMGEWKELADSLSRGSRFARGHPSGFSFVDLAADRSGFRIASAGIGADDARHVAARLSRVTAEQLIPAELMDGAEGMHGADFESAYGGVSDPRYTRAVAEIDAVLDRVGLVGR